MVAELTADGGPAALDRAGALGGAGGGWTAGGWLPLYDAETTQVYLRSPWKHGERLAGALETRAPDAKTLSVRNPALQVRTPAQPYGARRE